MVRLIWLTFHKVVAREYFFLFMSLSKWQDNKTLVITSIIWPKYKTTIDGDLEDILGSWFPHQLIYYYMVQNIYIISYQFSVKRFGSDQVWHKIVFMMMG